MVNSDGSPPIILRLHVVFTGNSDAVNGITKLFRLDSLPDEEKSITLKSEDTMHDIPVVITREKGTISIDGDFDYQDGYDLNDNNVRLIDFFCQPVIITACQEMDIQIYSDCGPGFRLCRLPGEDTLHIREIDTELDPFIFFEDIPGADEAFGNGYSGFSGCGY